LPVRSELAGQGLNIKEEQFGGVYYYDLVPGPREVASADHIRILVLALREMAEEEINLQRFPLVRGLESVKKLADEVVDSFGDILTYLYIDETHQAVNARLYEAVESSSGPVTLIGYSLGSIVSYCALIQNSEVSRRVSQLIMLGSPLFWFKHGVAARVGLEARPQVGRFVNIAGILDIALPQMVPKVLHSLDENIEFYINPLDPVKGHLEYFVRRESLAVIASEIKKGWT